MSNTNRQFLDHDWYDQPLPKNVSIGQGSWLYSSYAFRHYLSKQLSGVSIGDDTGLYNGTFFDLGSNGAVSIGNYCSIVGAIFCTNKQIIIHDYVFIAHEVVLADSAYAHPKIIENDKNENINSSSLTSIEIHNNVWIGMRAVLLQGACIGEGAIIGAGAVVDYEVPPYSIVAGSPSKIVGWVKK
jgi:acetyltransferase-like isoleucine patch superfamily enzyme